MCGIAGYFGTREIDTIRVSRCLHLMHHRGPDHAAYRCWKNMVGRTVYLLHTRLRIIDLDDRSNQPFSTGELHLAYNGELYNYVELGAELAAEGCDLTTRSDTEVLLQAIRHFGWSVLDRFEGMYAFAVYNEADGSLTLCRDRFGEKPLYIYEDKCGLYFASEIKFIAALLGRPLEVDFDHLYRYMVNGYKGLYKSGATFFKGIRELEPASFMRIGADGCAERKIYWTPAFHPDESLGYEDAVVGTRERLIRSVELRLRADVPLAFCMSGGVDSNALIGIAKRVFDYDVHGFTVSNFDGRYSEQELVDSAVAELDIRHTSVPVRRDGFLPKLRRLVRHHDAPVYTISYFAHWLLMEKIAEHGYRISVSGTAADELLTGYYDHHLAYLYDVRGDPELYAASRAAWLEDIRPWVRNPFLQNPDAFVLDPQMRDHIYLNADTFAQYFLVDWREKFMERYFTDSLLRNRMLNELFYESVPVILHEDDLNAMSFSIENRSPYLDRTLFEFCYSIPTRYLIRNGFAKAVLRDAVRGIVPDQIVNNRRKVGFNAPIFAFLDVNDPTVRDYLLDRSAIFDHVKRDRIEALLGRDHLPNSESKFLFYFLNSKMFLEEHATHNAIDGQSRRLAS